MIQYYDIIAPIPEAAHGLIIFYSGMMQRAREVSIAIPPEAPSNTYHFWLRGVAVEWYALGGAIP